MSWTVIYSEFFAEWLDSLPDSWQNETLAHIELLARKGIALPFPYSSKIHGSKVTSMRELRFKHEKRTLRILYVFDPQRRAVILIGGDKTGNKQWYDQNIPLAERIYKDYLRTVKEGNPNENSR